MINTRRKKTTPKKSHKKLAGSLAREPRQIGKMPKTATEDKTQKAIGERNRIALAYLELADDKTFQRLPDEQKSELVKEVLAIGDEVAGWMLTEHGTNDPRKIASRLGVKVFGEDVGKKKRSEYRRDKQEIVVYRNFHEKLIREIKSSQLADHLLKFMVAHELFHHLELTRVGEVYKRYTFETWHLGPYTRKRQIPALSDVAAQAFTQSLLKLEISPQVFDYLTYILFTNP